MKKTGLIIFTFIAALKVSNAQTVWGESSTRTENRDDAGLQGNAGAISGFFQTYNPINFPGAAPSWWHLLDVRHSNPANNYAMQFAGGFFDQDLYFRKTNNNPGQAWSKVIMATNGKVGIGTTNPTYTLDIQGATSGDVSLLRLCNYEGNYSSGQGSSILFSNQDWREYARVGGYTETNGSGANGYIAFSTRTNEVNSEKMRITSSGAIVIGTQDPKGYRLAVNGNAIATSVTVKLNGAWPDYVFKPSYHLLPLSMVKTYIDQNHHLPEMPSKTEVAKEDLNLGEMNRLLVKKVEELTLYLIKQAKTDDLLQKQLQAQQGEINLLKQNLKTRKASGKR